MRRAPMRCFDRGILMPGDAMCLAVPMRVVELDGLIARCAARGAERRVNLFLLQAENIAVGDYVAVHLGQAIAKVSEAEAEAAWALYDEMFGKEPTIRAAE
jgi:hydrogenase expression/formation protein HypC